VQTSHYCHPERSADAFCWREVDGSLFDFNRSKNAFVGPMHFAEAHERKLFERMCFLAHVNFGHLDRN
jgi:hypothetical protein